MVAEQNYYTVSRKIPHHARHSGYDQLSRYSGEAVEIPEWVSHLRGLGPVHSYFRKRSGMVWYNGLYSEFFTSLHMRKHSQGIYHVLFGENEFRYLPNLMPKRNHKVIATFHTPPSEFRKVMLKTSHLQTLDAIIAVAGNQLEHLEKIATKDRVTMIPHGVDIEYFVPPEKRSESKICICVGHHNRDFETLGKVATILRQKDPEVRVLVIDRVFFQYLSSKEQETYQQLFASAGNVDLLANLSDEQLLRAYQTSALMILPLHDTTANVAVLEALSCGLPMVVSDVGGMRDYANEECAVFAKPGDADTMANQVLHLLNTRTELQNRAVSSRQQALHFDWRVIAEKVKSVCSNL